MLTIEDGSGVTGADSYGTRAGYITYVLDYYGETIPDDETADASMRRAFAYLNGLQWKGSKTHGRDQVGAWPRTGVSDCDGIAIGDTDIPSEVIQAQYELARVEYNSAGTLSPSGSVRDALVSKEKVDVIQIEYDTSRLTAEQALQANAAYIESAMRLLGCFLTNGGRLVRRTDAITV
jgi:hypothetical protein